MFNKTEAMRAQDRQMERMRKRAPLAWALMHELSIMPVLEVNRARRDAMMIEVSMMAHAGIEVTNEADARAKLRSIGSFISTDPVDAGMQAWVDAGGTND